MFFRPEIRWNAEKMVREANEKMMKQPEIHTHDHSEPLSLPPLRLYVPTWDFHKDRNLLSFLDMHRIFYWREGTGKIFWQKNHGRNVVEINKKTTGGLYRCQLTEYFGNDSYNKFDMHYLNMHGILRLLKKA